MTYVPQLTFVVEVGLDDVAEKALTASATAAGHPVVTTDYIPTSHAWQIGFKVYNTHYTWFYGSIQSARVAIDHGLVVYGNYNQLRCSYYYPRLWERCLNHEYLMVTYGSLRNPHMKSMIFKALGQDGCVFVRPDDSRKVFNGQLLREEDWDVWLADIVRFECYPNPLLPETVLVFSTPKNVDHEWRFFVAGGQVVTGSLYKVGAHTHKQEPASADMLAKAQELADFCTSKGYDPDPLWVMDLCTTKGRPDDVRILEVGSASSAGLYACDTDKIVAVVAQNLMKKYKGE